MENRLYSCTLILSLLTLNSGPVYGQQPGTTRIDDGTILVGLDEVDPEASHTRPTVSVSDKEQPTSGEILVAAVSMFMQ